ncbi:hypothetical protein VTI74DRAFT_2492 [Chaetomium olivicolor]
MMSRAQQSSIRSFFQPRRQPEYAAPPNTPPQGPNDKKDVAAAVASPPGAPPAPPLPLTVPKPVTIPVTLPPNGIPVLPSPPSLPTGATIVPLEEHHIPALRRINSLLLPVAYPDSFYAKALDPLVSGIFSRVILWQDSDRDEPKVIGGLICRLEPDPFVDAQGQPLPLPPPPSKAHKRAEIDLNTPYHAIYIQSLVLLSPYRSLGLAAAALEHIIASAAILPAAGSSIDARTIYAHVWTENEEGLKWYEARGFTREGREPVKGYYFKLRPDTAWVVKRHIGPNTHCTSQPQPTTQPEQPTSKPTPGNTVPGAVLTAAINLPQITNPSAPPPLPSTLSPPPTSTTTTTTTTNTAGPRPSTSTPSTRPATGPPTGPPRKPTASPAPSTTSSLSFQNTRPETEWNDLPADMVTAATGSRGLPRNSSQTQLSVPNNNGAANGSGGPTSGASSRSSSAVGTGRKRRGREYPSAAFGNP